MSIGVWTVLVVVAGSALIAFGAAGSLVGTGVALVAVFTLFGVRLPGDGLSGGPVRRCSRRGEE